MCKVYLVHINNADWINTESDVLAEKCRAWAPGHSYVEFHSFQFIDGTGYTETVYDEVDFILQSNRDDCYISDPDEFIYHWQITEYAGYKLAELSGGWKKYLSLALFTNLKSGGKIYFDTFRQLSDRLIELLLTNLLRAGVSSVFLFDYDVSLFPTAIERKNIFLNTLNSPFAEVNSREDKSNSALNETNYYAED